MSIPRRRGFIFLVLILGIGAFLRFYRLDKPWLGQDEAETAVLAQTVSQKGIPNAYLEDRQIFLYTGHLIPFDLLENPSDVGRIDTRIYAYAQADFDSHGRLRYHPFGDIYLTALSFWLFGESTFTARLPFALVGVLLILVVYRFGDYLYNHHVGLVAASLQAINLNLLHYDRMARHPAPGNFCFFAALLFFLQAFRENKITHWMIADIFFVLLFFINPLFASLAFIILLTQSLLVDKNLLQLIRNKNLIVSAVVCFLAVLPYLLVLRPWAVTNMFLSPEETFFWNRIKVIFFFIPEWMSTVSFALVFLGLITLLRRRNTADLTLINMVFTFTFALLFLLPTTAGPYNTSLPLITFFVIIAAGFLVELYDYIRSRSDEKRMRLIVPVIPVIIVLLLFPKVTRPPFKLEKEFLGYGINAIRRLSLHEYLKMVKRNSIYGYLKRMRDDSAYGAIENQWNPMWVPEVIEFLRQKRVEPHEWVFTTYQNPTFLFYSDFKVQSIWPIRESFLDGDKERFWIIIGPNDHIRSPSKWYYGYIGWEERDQNRNYRNVVRNARTYRMKSGAVIYECNPEKESSLFLS